MKLRRTLKLGSLSIFTLLFALILTEHFLFRHITSPANQAKQPYVSACDASWAYLTVLEMIVAKMQAHLGDGAAAGKIRNYYAYSAGGGCRGKNETASYWTDLSAENGYVPAQQIRVSDAEQDYILRRADKIPWMEKAVAKGWHGAREALERMRKIDADWDSRPSLAFSLLETSAEAGYPDAQNKVVIQAEAMFSAGREDMVKWMEQAEKKGWKGAADALKRMRAQQSRSNTKSPQTLGSPDLINEAQ